MGERPRVRLGLVEEGAPLWLSWEGSPILGCGAISPPGLPSLPAAARDRVPMCARTLSAGPESWTVVRVIMIMITVLMRTMANTF